MGRRPPGAAPLVPSELAAPADEALALEPDHILHRESKATTTHRQWVRRMIVGVGASGMLCLCGGTAYGLWQAAGTGGASSTSGTAQNVTVGTTITGTLSPGGPSRDLAVSITNPNAQAITVTAIALNGAVTAGGGVGSCATTGVNVALPSSISFAVPATSSRTYTATGAVTMSTASESGCQGATFTIPLTVTAQLP
jgi:hypothetical protein